MCVHRSMLCTQLLPPYATTSVYYSYHHIIPTQWGNLPAQHLPTNLHPLTWQHVPRHQIESPSRWPFLVETHWIESIEWPRGGGCVRCCWVYSWLLLFCMLVMVAYSPLDRNDAGVKNNGMDGAEVRRGVFGAPLRRSKSFSLKGVPILPNSAKHPCQDKHYLW